MSLKTSHYIYALFDSLQQSFLLCFIATAVVEEELTA